MLRRGLAALLLGTTCLASACGDGGEERHNLLIISLDTLRADRLGCYGYERETTPALDRFATQSVRFEHAWAASCWTLPSHYTLFTGLHPASHGAEEPLQRPADDVPLLAEILDEEGYFTFALTDGGWLTTGYGFGRGFDSFHARRRGFGIEGRKRGFANTLARAKKLIQEREQPFFGFLHTYDVHCPYDPPEPYRSLFPSADSEAFPTEGKCGNPHLNAMGLSQAQALHLSDLYDGSIRQVDDALGDFFTFLEEEGFLEDTVLVITSDHGEEFLEHGQIGHERTLYREALAVPLLVRAPGFEPRVVDTPCGLVDVAPTVLELVGVKPKRSLELDGRSLVPLMQGRAPTEPVYALAQLSWQAKLDAWIGADAHVIRDRETGVAIAFDPVLDPDQVHPLEANDPRVVRVGDGLGRLIEGLQARRRATQSAETPTAEELEELKRLGYAGDG